MECFNADAAADEQMAGRRLRGVAPVDRRNEIEDIYKGVFSNILVVSKDKPHGARRTLL